MYLGVKSLSYSVKTLIEDVDLSEIGIEVKNPECEFDWGDSSEVKITATSLDVPFNGLKIILNSDSVYVHQLILNPSDDVQCITDINDSVDLSNMAGPIENNQGLAFPTLNQAGMPLGY